jgi:azurin
MIEFIAPEKGTYDYICSFPGHFAMMKGKLIVE